MELEGDIYDRVLPHYPWVFIRPLISLGFGVVEIGTTTKKIPFNSPVFLTGFVITCFFLVRFLALQAIFVLPL